MIKQVFRILLLILMLVFLIASTFFVIRYSNSTLFMIIYILIASPIGLETFLSLMCDDIPEFIDDLKR